MQSRIHEKVRIEFSQINMQSQRNIHDSVVIIERVV